MNRIGSQLKDGKAHAQDHKKWSRRSFLQTLGITGGASMLVGGLPVSAAASRSLATALGSGESDRVLVLIRLKGGNDGLNTIIPLYDYSTYINRRQTVGIPENEITELANGMGIPETLDSLMPLWNEGQMKVINSVGYPDQNLSHFRSTDIWASASDANVLDGSGWLGRYIVNQNPDYLENPPDVPPAIQIGGSGTNVFNDGDFNSLAVGVQNPEELAEIAQTGQLYDTSNIPDCFYGEQVGFLRTAANATFLYADAIKEAFDNSTTQADYNNGFGEQLALVARLIKGNLGTKLYMVTLDGFDTHARQTQLHPNLMRQLSTGIKAFYEDLAAGQREEDVLCMTFSEFGRRIEQNSSNGTDHGAAAPLMLFGGGLNGNGMLGDRPDLNNTDGNGNLTFSTDFRAVYATVLENWLCLSPNTVDGVMGEVFPRMDLGISCMATGIFSDYTELPFMRHEARYDASGGINIYYELPVAAEVRVEIFDILGQPVENLYRGRQLAGTYQYPFKSNRMGRLAAGAYVYRILVNGKAYSGKTTAR
ncbi:MAG: DUF1501 domain-containing protein [Saprospiraceae bacterium]